MDYLKHDQSLVFKKGNITAYEYPTKNKIINNSFIEIKGRHPQEGWAYNEVCIESVFIIRGSVVLTTKTESVVLEENDTVIIDPNERYFFEGDCDMVSPSSPPWYPEQSKIEK